MKKEIMQELENEIKFKFFLLKFWVKGMEEYKSFNEDEKRICLEEFRVENGGYKERICLEEYVKYKAEKKEINY